MKGRLRDGQLGFHDVEAVSIQFHEFEEGFETLDILIKPEYDEMGINDKFRIVCFLRRGKLSVKAGKDVIHRTYEVGK